MLTRKASLSGTVRSPLSFVGVGKEFKNGRSLSRAGTEESKSPVFDAIVSRKSIRSFEDKPVEDEKLRICLEAARRAPSWASKQCWHFVVVRGQAPIEELGIVPKLIGNVPTLIVACGDPDKSGNMEGKPYYMADVTKAVEHIVLAAWEQGLGTCWVGAFKEDRVRQALGITAHIRMVALLPIGYPADKESVRTRNRQETHTQHREKGAQRDSPLGLVVRPRRYRLRSSRISTRAPRAT
ncbi:MAG: nitroreductase family protein [Thermoplasmata archaeon]